MGSSLGRRYRYGASFVDQTSGVRFEGHHPLERPDLWQIYLNEAEGKYRNHGFEGTLRRKELEDGRGVSLFFIGFSPEGQAVAGVRFHGPLENSHQAFLLEEMAASPEIGDIEKLIDGEIRLGALEVKGAWSKGEAETGHRLIATISRSVTHAMNWLGAEFAIAGVSDSLVPFGNLTGARMVGTCWVPYPDDRYRTVAVSWRRSRSQELSSPPHQQALRQEAEQLARGPISAAGPVEHDLKFLHSRRPLVLDVEQRAQREVLRVLREDSSLQIVDRLHEQREQLGQLIPTPTANVLEEGQRWVYYPWRRAVVRLLGPRAFSMLRLDRNRNKMTRAEQARQRTLRVGVVGASAGQSIAHLLALEGLVGELRLADFDTLELSNLNRIAASVLDLGVNKAIVAARRIAEVDPFLNVVVVPEGVNPENLGQFIDGLDLVIEECDSLDMKFLVREAARERRIPVIMETSDRGVLDVERFDLEPDRPIFHGLLGDMDYSRLRGLSTEEKGPYLLKMLGTSDVTSRGAASLFELGQTITGWPQLASEVTLGAVTTATAVRRFGLGGDLPSGRVRFDVEEVLSGLKPVDADRDREADFQTPPPEDPRMVGGDAVDQIVDAARRAPSGGNVQPWRFEADDREVRFYMVPERSGSSMDVQHRGSYVALGAALFNARVAAAANKVLGPVQLFPEGRPSHHVATLTLGSTTDAEIVGLNEYVTSRVANRRMGRPTTLEPSTIELLDRVVDREGARLRLATSRDLIDDCAQLLADCDRLRFLIPSVHREMLHEIRWPGRDALEDGLDVRSLEMDAASSTILDLLGRPDVMGHLADWRGGQALGLKTKFAVSSSSALAVITVPRPDPIWYLRGGAAMERFWLTAEMRGLSIQPVVPLFMYATDDEDLVRLGGERHLDELHNLSEKFHDMWDLDEGEVAAMVVRVFHAGPPTVRSVRLPLSQVLSREFDDPSTSPSTNGHGAALNGHSTSLNGYAS